MERDLESWIDVLLRGPAVESGTEMEEIGEAFGRGWARANPPHGLVGRRCDWKGVSGSYYRGTIRAFEGKYPDLTHVYIEWDKDNTTSWRPMAEVDLIPWGMDESAVTAAALAAAEPEDDDD